MNAYDEIEKLQKRVDALEDAVKRHDGWIRCPHCKIWHEPDGMTLIACRCGYDFRFRAMRCRHCEYGEHEPIHKSIAAVHNAQRVYGVEVHVFESR